MKALIDADILLYQSAFAGQDRDTGEIHSFDYVAENFESNVEMIKRAVEADEAILYLTGPNNFRFNIAKTKPYKGTRQEEKPYHYKNLRFYIEALPNAVVTDGYEADDAMCIEQYKRLESQDTIICSRDKDLRMCPGWHYGWEHGGQPEFFPTYVSPLGEITLSEDKKKIKGTGLKFFYSQLITGDSVDNIPGLPKGGPVLAALTLADAVNEQEMCERVATLYHAKLGDNWYEYFLEQAQLLWMVREVDENNIPIMWRPPIDIPSIPRCNEVV